MVGGKGRGKGAASKSKRKALALVPAAPEPLIMEESTDCRFDGEEKISEIPDNGEKSMDEEGRDDTVCELVIDNGHEEKQLLEGEKNDEEQDAVNELNDDRVDNVCMPVEMEEDTEEENDGGDAANKVNSEDNEETTNEEDPEEVSGGGGAANNVDVEDNEEMTNEEVPEEDKEPMNDCLGNKDINTGEEKKISEPLAEGQMVISEGFTASEHGITDEDMTNDLQNEREANKLNSEEPPMGSLVDNEKIECSREDASIADNVNTAPENVNKPKKKVVKKKVVKKKMVLKNDVASKNNGKPQPSIGNDASVEAKQVETNEHEKNEEKAEVKQPVKVNKKLNRVRRKEVSENHAGVAAASDEQKSQPTNNEPGSGELVVKDEEAAKSGGQASRLKKRRKKKVTKDDTSNVVSGDINKTGPSQKKKSSKKVDSMGMIFMCSSETKKDCYRYKVLGLPAGKKDLVLKIYKGMRLFLFDLDLRMMYGIYKAADPGGFNIEPKAFKSQFPSQVRFTVLEECVPLAEEKFKSVIKENYYAKNKFNCQLTHEQVKKLCKLFNETTKRADSKQIGRRSQITAASSSAPRDRKRKRVEDVRKEGPTSSSSKRERRSRRRDEEDVRRRPPPPVVIDDVRAYYHQHVYEREAYLPAIAAPLYQPLPAHSPPRLSSYSSYGGASRVDIYRRDPALERRELGLSSLQELRHPVPLEPDRHDPYVSYREPRVSYHEPVAYETSGARRDRYESGARPQHYDYSTSDLRQVDYYRPAEYRAPLPPYRRY